MTVNLSLYLDVVRFLAALAVLGTHLNDKNILTPVSWWSPAHGSCAVVVFFVLSGYVISHVVTDKEKTARAYAVSRLTRLYSVLLVALVVTAACDSVGVALNPGYYRAPPIIARPGWQGYLATAALVNEFQLFKWNGTVAGSNSPLWSLSFEAAFYVAAGLLLFARSPLKYLAVALWLACAGRTITALAPLWLLGFLLHRFRHRLAVDPWLAGCIFPLTLLALWAWPADGEVLGLTTTTLFWLPWDVWQFNRNILADYLCAAVFAANLVCAARLAELTVPLRGKTAGAIRWLGALTFPLYCLHKPLLYLLASTSPFAPDGWARPLFLTFCTGVVVVLSVPICDGIKNRMRHALAQARLAVR